MEVVGEHGGGFAPSAFDERGPLPGDHGGGGGGERSGVLVDGGQDVEGNLHAAADDGFGGAGELVDDGAVVILQQVDEGVAAGQEHVDVGADAVLPAGREDRTAAEVRENTRAEHLGWCRVNDAALAAHRPASGSGSVTVSMGCPGTEAASRRR